MKTKIKIAIVGTLVALLPGALAIVAIKLEGPREFVQLGQEDQAAETSVAFSTSDTTLPDRTFPEAVRYELGITPEKVRKHRRPHRAQNVSLAPGAVKRPGRPPCVKRGGITICDPKTDTRTSIRRRPHRSHGWYLPKRPTNELKPFGNE